MAAWAGVSSPISTLSLASFGTALRTRVVGGGGEGSRQGLLLRGRLSVNGLFSGYWVSMSNQVFSWSPVNLRSEVTETPGWLWGQQGVSQGQDSGISPAGTNTKGITGPPSLTAQPVPGRGLVTLRAAPLLPANDKRGPLWSLRSLGRAGSAPG